MTVMPQQQQQHLPGQVHRTTPDEQDRDDSILSPYKAAPGSRFMYYNVKVDHSCNDRSTELRLCSFQRPHARALHCAWISFFLAFTIWFAAAPLLPEIRTTLNLSDKQIWTSSICSDVTTIFMRILVGPLCDQFGARIPMGVVLCIAAIPTSMLGLVNSGPGLCVLRLFVGIAGSTFVMAQHWPTCMFTNECAGTVNGIVGGWGNLGGAFTQVLMGSILFPAFEKVFDSAEKSWRLVCIFPAFVAFCWGLIVIRISDDAPYGYYRDMRKEATMDMDFYLESFRSSGIDMNTWILWAQYGCCFGVELIMNNAAALYFVDEFGLDTQTASAVGAVFGAMNLFARGLGGLSSDKLNLKVGMRGRLWLNTILLILEGVMILVFAFADSLGGAVATMLVFSIFTQAAEGGIYGVVPYVKPRYVGTVAGIVGAGGNMGGVVFGLGFRSLSYKNSFLMMGSIVIASSFLSVFIKIYGHAGLIWGEESPQAIAIRQRHMDTVNNHEHEEDRNRGMEREDHTAQQNPEDGASPLEIDEQQEDEESGARAADGYEGESPVDKETPVDKQVQVEPELQATSKTNSETANANPEEE